MKRGEIETVLMKAKISVSRLSEICLYTFTKQNNNSELFTHYKMVFNDKMLFKVQGQKYFICGFRMYLRLLANLIQGNIVVAICYNMFVSQ